MKQSVNFPDQSNLILQETIFWVNFCLRSLKTELYITKNSNISACKIRVYGAMVVIRNIHKYSAHGRLHFPTPLEIKCDHWLPLAKEIWV